MPSSEEDLSTWTDTIVSTLQGCGKDGGKTGKMPVKELRKVVFLSMQIDSSDKTAKKKFKGVVQELEKDKTVSLNSDGIVKLKNKGKTKKRKIAKDPEGASEQKKIRSPSTTENQSDSNELNPDENDTAYEEQKNDSFDDKNKACKGNPQGVTRIFLGNLPFTVDEGSLGAFLPGTITHIKWITDKETGKFYGSAFCEMDTPKNAGGAVAMAGQKLLGRPIKINFAPSRPGDIWPPPKKVVKGGGGGQAGGSGVKAMSEKPEDCLKLFIGNLSYDIDDDIITKFFANVDAEVKAVRWLHHKDTGDFKGVGFVEFWKTEACEKGATLNGKNLLGRPIRIDWTD